jgi:hypothetical protein
MAENQKNVDELINKVDEFERTVTGLLENIRRFKAKLAENKSKFGPDVSKWPNSASGGE